MGGFLKGKATRLIGSVAGYIEVARVSYRSRVNFLQCMGRKSHILPGTGMPGSGWRVTHSMDPPFMEVSFLAGMCVLVCVWLC